MTNKEHAKHLKQLNNDEALEYLSKLTDDELDELDELDDEDTYTVQDYQFEKELQSLFLELLPKGDIEEQFVNKQKAFQHYARHCLANNPKHKSSRSNVYYDFTDAHDYLKREQLISNLSQSPDVIEAPCLLEYETVIKQFHRLFAGNTTLVFSYSGNLMDEQGREIRVVMHSFATDVTTNYSNNTLDLLVERRKKTRTLYPIDANYLQQKFNNIVQRTYPELKFSINH